MHVLFRESHGLEETAQPEDLGQSPADLVVLSFSDSDLGAFAAGWRRARGGLPALRLANLARLRHPLSVDTYVDQTLGQARGVLVRLIGGQSYWSYGVEELARIARRRNIALAFLPADGRPDPSLEAASTLPVATLRRLSALCEAGGEIAAQAALAQLALASGLYAGPVPGLKILPPYGFWHPASGPMAQYTPPADRPLIALPFYRAWAAAADTAPLAAVIAALEARGLAAIGLYVPGLKEEGAAAWLRAELFRLRPAAILNATAFSGRGAVGSPLDAPEVPVFQMIHTTSTRSAWEASDRGLSAADLAMHVALPELDGRLAGGVVSFKEIAAPDPDLQCALQRHQPWPEGIAALVGRLEHWLALQRPPPAPLSPAQISVAPPLPAAPDQTTGPGAATAAPSAPVPPTRPAPPRRRRALILSTYPGKEWRLAHAVGLDVLASAAAIAADLGQDISPEALLRGLQETWLEWPAGRWAAACASLPAALRARVDLPQTPPKLRAFWAGDLLIALQPERDPPPAMPAQAVTIPAATNSPPGTTPPATSASETRDASTPDRADSYHDLARDPGPEYVAFYLWLRHVAGVEALIHIGAHGTLEWLPGKAVALGPGCWPEALTGGLPVLYPFIVNDPGEAAQARRRLGALTLGHLPPPLVQADLPPALVRLEHLLDEYSTADGLDPARRLRLIAAIRTEARTAGLEADLGLAPEAGPAEAITAIDRFVCDLKESQFGDGLHIWGRGTPDGAGGLAGDAEALAMERAALPRALAGRRIAPGPSGSPWRGRRDVLPTGRMLYGIDPRAVPSRAAWAQGVILAEALLRRHLQDHGDYPKAVMLNLWGSAAMRTAGEDFAMALHLAGLKPVWQADSERVTGFEIQPYSQMDRPRIEVSLRVSGLFRDTFPELGPLFEAGCAALAARDEAPDVNPYVAAPPGPRVFGPAPGHYGTGIDDGQSRDQAGAAWLAASVHDIAGAPAPQALAERLRATDSFVLTQDLPETDLLLAMDYASHQGGFAAARHHLGLAPVPIYHLDATRPAAPQARPLPEEIARVVRARAANPRWIAAMARHGFRGAAEIAATLEHLCAFAHWAEAVPSHLFALYHAATLGTPEVARFLAEANPGALARIKALLASHLPAAPLRPNHPVDADPDADPDAGKTAAKDTPTDGHPSKAGDSGRDAAPLRAPRGAGA